MAKIMTVDYEAIPGQASQMRSLGQTLNAELTNAYASITDMHAHWYGKRYNSLVQIFNNLIPQLDELLELVVGEIPFTLETIANNYSQADRGSNATSANKTAPNKIATIPISNDVGMRFLTQEVVAVQQSVSKNFKNSVDNMNAIENVYNGVTWQSEAADAFRARFQKLKSEIIASFEDINAQFTSLMTQTQEDIQNTESANTVQ